MNRPKPKPKPIPRSRTINRTKSNTMVTKMVTNKSKKAIKPVPRTRVPVSDMAFLFLTYDDITHQKTKDFIKGQSVYVNAKTPTTISKRYQVESYETEWGKKSIVDATIKLLEKAYAKNHQWYILLAYDVYPLVSMDDFKYSMKFQSKSMFHVLKQQENEWKASQWWILSKEDVGTILSRRADYEEYLKKRPYKIMAAWDELYFLSLLKYVNPAYTFTDHKTVYVEWLKNNIQTHPVIFNRLLQTDLDKMKGSFFLRKTTPTFSPDAFELKKQLVIKIVGDKSPAYEPGNHDLIVVGMRDVDNSLKSKALYIYHSLFKPLYSNILEILDTIPVYLWSEVIIVTEEGTKNSIGPSVKEKVSLPSTSLSSPKHFYALDNAFLYSPDKIAFLFLTIGNVNQHNVWNEYFKHNWHKISIYRHAKNPEQVFPFLNEKKIDTVKTGWGFITNAYYHLFQEAIKDVNNVKFVTISESCIPLKRFDTFYNKMMEHDIRTSFVKFMRISKYDREQRIETQPGYEKYEFTKHYARMCLSRYHVAKLLKESFDFFNKMHVGDEFFLSLLKARDKVDYMKDFEITYDNWEDTQKKRGVLSDEIYQLEQMDKSFLTGNRLRIKESLRDDVGRNPKTYFSISVQELEAALNKESFFWRKFPAGPLPWTNNILTLDKPIRAFIAERKENYTKKTTLPKSKR